MDVVGLPMLVTFPGFKMMKNYVVTFFFYLYEVLSSEFANFSMEKLINLYFPRETLTVFYPLEIMCCLFYCHKLYQKKFIVRASYIKIRQYLPNSESDNFRSVRAT